MEKTRGNTSHLQQERFHLKYEKEISYAHWNNFPGDVVESALLEFFKMQLDSMLDISSRLLSHERLDQMIFQGPF